MRTRVRGLISRAVVAALFLGLAMSPTAPAGAADATATPIKHLVVIFGENISFDHYYGTYPIATNPSGASSSVNTGNTPGPGNVFGGSFLTPDFAAGHPLIGSGSQRVMQVGLKLTF